MKASNSASPLGILVALLLLAGCGAADNSSGSTVGRGSAAATVSTTTAVGTAPSAIAADTTNNKIYVADFGTQPALGPLPCSPTGADLTMIDGTTESATAAPLLSSPLVQLNPIGIALSPEHHAIYLVARKFSPNVSTGCTHLLDGVDWIDTSTLLTNGFSYQVSAIGGFLTAGIAVNEVTGNIYVAHNSISGDSITVIGGNGVVATISVGTNPIGIAVNANTNTIYVANRGSNSISVIDGATNSVTTITDPNAMAPVAVAVNPATNTIYVANGTSNNVSVIDGSTGSVMATVPVGTSPSGIAVDSQTNFIYVANAGDSQTGDPGDVTIINGATNHTTTLMDPKAVHPAAVAVNSVTNKIYVANSGSSNVTVIDGAHD